MPRRRATDETPMSFFSFQDIIACTTGIMVLLTLLLTMELLTRTLGAADVVSVTQQEVDEARRKRDELRARMAEGRKMLARLAKGETISRTQIEHIQRIVEGLTKENSQLVQKIPKTEKEIGKTTAEGNAIKQEIVGLRPEVKHLGEVIASIKKQPPVTVLDRSLDGKRPLWVECASNLLVVSEIPRAGATAGYAKEIRRFAGDQATREFVAWAKSDCRPDKDKFVLLVRPDAIKIWEVLCANLNVGGFAYGWDVWASGKNLLGEEKEGG